MAPSDVVFCSSDVLVLLTVNDLTPAGVFPRNARGACCTLLPYIDFFTRAYVSILVTYLVLGLCVSEFSGGFVTTSCLIRSTCMRGCFVTGRFDMGKSGVYGLLCFGATSICWHSNYLCKYFRGHFVSCVDLEL